MYVLSYKLYGFWNKVIIIISTLHVLTVNLTLHNNTHTLVGWLFWA